MTLFYQFVSTAIICFVCVNLGIQYALPSSTLKVFGSENTTLDRIMTDTEQSLMGSISSASTLIVTPFCGYLLNIFGRKRTLILFYFPQFVSWLVLVTILKVEAFIFAMFLCGLSGSILLVALVYINEFCEPSIRGRLSSTILIFNEVGVLLSYLFGGILDYKTMSYLGLTLNVFGLVLLCFLKESPLYLMKIGLKEKAAQSIAFYKGIKTNSVEVMKEMENIIHLINTDLEIKSTPEEEKFKPHENKVKEKILIRTLFIKSSSSRRAFFVLLVLFTLTILQGVNVVKIFAGPLFQAAIPSITATLTTVLFAVITVIAGVIGAYLTDKVGRRILLITASIATGLFCVILATNIQFNWAPNMLTAVLIYFYTFSYGVGAGTVPYVLVGEVFLPEVSVIYLHKYKKLTKKGIRLWSDLIACGILCTIKGFATTLCIEWTFVCNFIMFYLFVPIFSAYGLGPLFYFFSACSFFTAIFSFIYLPETRSLPVDVIQTKFFK